MCYIIIIINNISNDLILYFGGIIMSDLFIKEINIVDFNFSCMSSSDEALLLHANTKIKESIGINRFIPVALKIAVKIQD